MTGPSWATIRAGLVERGLWTEDGLSRKAKARSCRKCSAPIMAGLDHDRSAMAVYLDPAPLNALGEAIALLTGRQTFSLRWCGGHYEIDPRYAEHISGSPAGSDKRIEILATHLCQSPAIPLDHQAPPIVAAPITQGADSDQPPF